MTYSSLIRDRLDISMNSESRDTHEAVRMLGVKYRSQGTFGSGHHVDEALKLFIRGLERPVRSVLDGLRKESKHLSESARSELLNAAITAFKDWIVLNSRRRMMTLRQDLQMVGQWSTSHEELARGAVDQLTINLVSITQKEIVEIGDSHRLLLSPQAPTTELASLINDVSRLEKAQGAVEEFVRQNAERLERIDSALTQQEADVKRTADLVMQMGLDKPAAMESLNRLASGTTSHEQLKSVLSSLFDTF